MANPTTFAVTAAVLVAVGVIFATLADRGFGKYLV